ncbi:MAG: ABC-F family ATP-binding cassette domain-containing protein [Firmicutes bacterium]|nr:ABC-F family ATP-binding cassette domain-containing protein [Bacillota bacterium]
MIIISCNNISLSFGDKRIIENALFSVDETDKIGLVGVNGAGKSTLFKIIGGVMPPDSGDIFIAKDKKIGYLEQHSGLDSSKSIWDEMLSAFSDLIELEQRINAIQQKMSMEEDKQTLAALMAQYDMFMHAFNRAGGYAYNSRIKGILRGLGFEDHQFQLPIATLSGGQKTKIALAKLLVEEPDILLLDEPTNHLDIKALEWLEEFLKGYDKCVFVISHDRYFLDAVTTKTIEIENCDCTLYNGNYSTYMEKKRTNREIQQRHYENQQKDIARMEATITKFKQWNREKSIKRAESKQKALDKIERLEAPKASPAKVSIAFKTDTTSGKDVLSVKNMTKRYPGKCLFEDISFNIQRGEKIFLLGPNGCGKSTLLKILTDKLDKNCGHFEYGHKVQMGYYDQEQEDLNICNNVIDEVWNAHEKLTQTEVRNALAAYLFKGDDVFKPISVLSGGEKSRVALLKLLLSGANLLILDEPTNHLDINAREALEQSLQDYDGTVFAVSHDRYFINKLSTRVLEINNGSLIDYPGSYSAYVQHKKQGKKKDDIPQSQNKGPSSKLAYEKEKQAKAAQRKMERQFKETEQEIMEIETRLEEIEREMTSEHIGSDHQKLSDLYDEQSTLQKRLEKLYDLWEELSSD